MASKNLQFKITGNLTKELIERYDNNENIFYRFHNPYCRLTSRSKSWGMIYQTEVEAIREGCSVLNGKSCCNTLGEVLSYADYFDKDYVLLIFNGKDTGEIGHDGETVAKYYSKEAVWSYTDIINNSESIFKNKLNKLENEYKNADQIALKFGNWSELFKLRELYTA